MNTLIEIANKIRNLDKFTIVGHLNPDGDSIGSCLGLSIALKSLSKESCILWPDPVPLIYRYLPDLGKSPDDINKDEIENVIFLDCSNPERVGDQALGLLNGRKLTINIDHHQDNMFFGDFNYVVPQSSSTAEIIYELITCLEVEISKDIADCLYAGIVMDSGSFLNSNTTSSTMKTAAILLDKGADVDKIRNHLFESKPYEEVLLLRQGLENLEFHLNGRVAVMILGYGDIHKIEALDIHPEGIINYARSIAGVEVAVLIRENSPGECKIGLRSKSYIDVAILAGQLGGGGHQKAAGAQQQGNPEQVKKLVLKMLEDVLV